MDDATLAHLVLDSGIYFFNTFLGCYGMFAHFDFIEMEGYILFQVEDSIFQLNLFGNIINATRDFILA